MSDPTQKDNIRQFPLPEERATLKRLVPEVKGSELPPPAEQKLGVYPLADDVIVSKPLFVLILTVLEDPDVPLERRTRLAQHLRMGYEAPWTPAP